MVFNDSTSELTRNAPGPWKQIWEEEEEPMVTPHPIPTHNALPDFRSPCLNPNNIGEATTISIDAQLSHEQSRLLESIRTSTSKLSCCYSTSLLSSRNSPPISTTKTLRSMPSFAIRYRISPLLKESLLFLWIDIFLSCLNFVSCVLITKMRGFDQD